MSQNLTLPLLAQTKILQQKDARARLNEQNRAAAREILLRVQLILSRNQIK